MLKEENTYLKNVFKAVIVILFYLVAYSSPVEFLKMLNIDIYKLNNIMKSLCLVLY